MSSWCTIESDPGVFTELISSFGVRDVEVEELYTLDPQPIQQLQPVYGLIFLFKWQTEHHSQCNIDMPGDTYTPLSEKLFFARQMINNACATQAILNVLLNNPQIELGPELTNFKEFTRELPPDVRGLALGESQLIRQCHNSFRRPESFVFEEKISTNDEEAEDAFHFVSYVFVDGDVYELDGLARTPVNVGSCQYDQWIEIAVNSIQKKINLYAQKEIRFNLMAVVKNRATVYNQRLEELQKQKSEIEYLSHRTDEQNHTLRQLNSQISDVNHALSEEASKIERWRLENIRRRHNYVPFIFNVLKILAEKQKLNKLVENACRMTAERNARARDRREKQQELEKKAKDQSVKNVNQTSAKSDQHSPRSSK